METVKEKPKRPGDPNFQAITGAYIDLQEARIGIENRLREAFGGTEEDRKLIAKRENISLKRREEENLVASKITKLVHQEPIWTNWLKGVRGIGEIITSQMLGMVSYCENFDKRSSLYHYMGYHVKDGHAPKKTRGEHIDWNPNGRKLGYNIAKCFVRTTGPYRALYDNYKERYTQRMKAGTLPCSCTAAAIKSHKGHYCQTKGHADNMAMRATVKLFLSHYWEVGRTLKGLTVEEPYPIGVLKHKTQIDPPNWIKK